MGSKEVSLNYFSQGPIFYIQNAVKASVVVKKYTTKDFVMTRSVALSDTVLADHSTYYSWQHAS